MPDPTFGDDGRTIYTDVEFAMPTGYRPLRLDLTVPPVGAPVPVVLFIHGGAFMFGSRRSHPLLPPIREALLDRGIAVAAVEYRLSGEARFPALVHDVHAAVRWLRSFGPAIGLRGDAIGAWGESAGGYLAVFLGLNITDPALVGDIGVADVSSDVQAAVGWYPPTRFLTMDAEAPPEAAMPHDAADSPESLLIGGAIQENPEATAFASPISHVGPAAAPMLLIHGLRDRVVPFPQSVALDEALRRVGADVTLELVPDADHVFVGVDVAPIVARSADFLAERLH